MMTGSSFAYVTAIMTKVSLRADAAAAFAKWQAGLTRSITTAQGFVSVEIVAAFSGSSVWQIIQRFRSHDGLELWRTSKARAALLADLAPMREQNTGVSDEVAPDFHSLSCVTEVITTVVEPGKEHVYRQWTETLQAAQATFPGYMGTLVQAPLPPEVSYWTTLVRFVTPAQLNAWLTSDARKAMLQKADPLVATWRSQRMPRPCAVWFESDPSRGPAPATWKQTTLVLLVLFPVVMLEIRFLSPYLASQHLAIATFVGNAISVSLVSWPLMPIAIYCLNWWLRPKPARRVYTEVIGALAMMALYSIELTTFVSLF